MMPRNIFSGRILFFDCNRRRPWWVERFSADHMLHRHATGPAGVSKDGKRAARVLCRHVSGSFFRAMRASSVSGNCRIRFLQPVAGSPESPGRVGSGSAIAGFLSVPDSLESMPHRPSALSDDRNGSRTEACDSGAEASVATGALRRAIAKPSRVGGYGNRSAPVARRGTVRRQRSDWNRQIPW